MKKTFCLRVAFAACAALAAVFQLIAVLMTHDAGTHYFERGSIFPTLSVIFAVVGAICATAAACMTHSDTINSFPFSKTFSVSPMVLGFLAAAAVLILTQTSSLGRITAILMILSALYQLLIGNPATQRSTPVIYLGLVSVIAMILLNAVYYFDVTMEMNSPFKVSVQIALLFAMLARTSELRCLIGRPQPRMLLILSSWTVAIGAIPALSLPIAFFSNKTDRLDYAAGGFFVLCAVISSLLRIGELLKSPIPQNDGMSRLDEPNERI